MKGWLWLSIFISFITGMILQSLSVFTGIAWILWITGLVLCMPFIGWMLVAIYIGLRYGGP